MNRNEVVIDCPLPLKPSDADIREHMDENGHPTDGCADLFLETEVGMDNMSEAVAELFAWNHKILAKDHNGQLIKGPDGFYVAERWVRKQHLKSAAFLAAFKSGDHAEMGRIVSSLMQAALEKTADWACDDVGLPSEAELREAAAEAYADMLADEMREAS